MHSPAHYPNLVNHVLEDGLIFLTCLRIMTTWGEMSSGAAWVERRANYRPNPYSELLYFEHTDFCLRSLVSFYKAYITISGYMFSIGSSHKMYRSFYLIYKAIRSESSHTQHQERDYGKSLPCALLPPATPPGPLADTPFAPPPPPTFRIMFCWQPRNL